MVSAMSTPTLSRTGNVFVLDFGDDENVTGLAWIETMHRLLDEVGGTEGPAALVTIGSAKHYSNGLDVAYMATIEPYATGAYVEDVLDIVRRIMLLGMPTVAAVNGHAFGMGAFLVLAHDRSVMRDDRGYLCFPEVHLGMPFTDSLLDIARASLTPRTLRQALTTGHRYSGPAAVAGQIVDDVAPLDELLATATQIGEELAATAGPNLALIKRQILPAVAAAVEGRS